MTYLLWAASLSCMAVGFLYMFQGVEMWRVGGWFALANGIVVVALILEGYPLWRTSISTALAARGAYDWWKGGGGDGTKRRLRGFGRAFTPVRRTASAA